MVGGVIMPRISLDNKLYMQVRLAHKYMKRHNISIEQFRQQDREYDILGFLEDGYEPYHLTGDEGVLDEIDAIVAGQKAAKSGAATPSAGNPL
jgi:hypothetical protein